MPRVTQAQAQKTREKIIKSAYEIIINQGGDKLTFSRIAAHANIGKSGVTTHFKKKEDLLEELAPFLERRIASHLSFNSIEEFYSSWKDAVDNSDEFLNIAMSIQNNYTSLVRLKRYFSHSEDPEKVSAIIYMAVGYAITALGSAKRLKFM